MRAALPLAAFLSFGCASMTTAEKWNIGLAAADVATTAYALDHGMREMNPILRADSNAETVARAVVLNAALLWLQHKYLARYTVAMQKIGWRVTLYVRAPAVAWNLSKILQADAEAAQ